MGTGIGLFGGSFDPIHFGHLIVARAVGEALDLQRVILLPSRIPPHKQSRVMSPAEHRAAMARLAIADDPFFEISDHDLTCSGPSYTINTVTYFRSLLGAGPDLAWFIGADSLLELHLWHRVADLVETCRIVTAARPGCAIGDLPDLSERIGEVAVARLRRDVLTTPQIDISATDIRRRVADGRSIRYLVPEAVRGYILENGLYGPGRSA
jgi:nicotinate-nucleotide adenylyltransferase